MTNETILIAIAWPYANAPIHVGNLTGTHLPGDIVARYHRLKGDRVLMVSGTDSHGTPVTIRADADGKPVDEVYQMFHNQFIDLFQQAGISYDLFTTTHTANHFKVSQTIFLALKENGFLYTETLPQWYSPAAKKFLPDRYVEGTCYICGFEGARSDQCDNCGSVLEPEKLLNPRSKADGSTPELRDTEHFFLDLSKLSRRWSTSCALARATCASLCWVNRWARSRSKGLSPVPSRVTWIGASPSPWKAGTENVCTSGSRPSSATCLPPSSGRKSLGGPTPGAIGGLRRKVKRSISLAKTTSSSTCPCGPPS